jgi:hypothetical protein
MNGMRNLDNLVDAPGTFTLDWGVEIHETGWIVGIGHYGPGWGTSRGFVLDPIPAVATPEDLISAGRSRLHLAPNRPP